MSDTTNPPEPTCADYKMFLNNPGSVQDIERRIALIRHAATCAECLDLVFTKLSELAQSGTQT